MFKAVKAPPDKKGDLRPFCPPVYDQGQLGSCTANAIAAAYQYEQKRLGFEEFMPSRLFIYYNERAMEGTIDSDAGACIRDGIKSVNAQGVCDEDNWEYIPERFSRQPFPYCYRFAELAKAVSYRRLTHSVADMESCLAQGFPFVFGVTVYTSFPMESKTGTIPMPKRNDSSQGGHAMLCVGYDRPAQKFIVRNSWGESWGNKGYGTIPYAYLSNPNLGDDYWTITAVTK